MPRAALFVVDPTRRRVIGTRMGNRRRTLGSVVLVAFASLSVVTRAADPMAVGPPFEVEDGGWVASLQLADVAGLPTGEFVVVWSQSSGFERTYARAFAANGTPASGNVLVGPKNDEGGFRVSWYPQVAANAAGKFVVVWTQEDYLPNPPHSIEARVLDATATPQGPKFTIADLRAYEFSASIAAGATGEFVVTWDDAPYGGSGTQDIYGRRLDANGALDGGVFPIEVGAGDEEEAPAVAAMPADGFVVAWSPDGTSLPAMSIVGRRFDAANAPLGDFVVTGDAYIGSYPGDGFRHAVASNPSGEFAVAWSTDSTGQVMVQRYDATGTAVGTPVQASQNDGAQGADLIVEDDGSFVVVWSEDFRNGIAGRRFSAASGTFGDEFVVTTADVSERPTIASTGPGTFVVAWGGYDAGYSYDRVLARRFVIPAPTEVGIAGTKLIAVDKLAAANKAKVVYVARNDPGIAKGAGGDPALLSGLFEVVYTDQPTSVAGSFVLPSPWRTAKDTVAKYVNSLAPGGTGDAKVAVVKDGLRAKVAAKGLGDGPALDLVAAGAPGPGGVTTALTVLNGNDGTERRMCTRFSEADGSTMIFREIAGGTGRKLLAREGVPAPCP
jgi:hypothetical protein